MKKISDEVNVLLKSSGFDEKYTFNYCDVVSAVSRLYNGRSTRPQLYQENLLTVSDNITWSGRLFQALTSVVTVTETVTKTAVSTRNRTKTAVFLQPKVIRF